MHQLGLLCGVVCTYSIGNVDNNCNMINLIHVFLNHAKTYTINRDKLCVRHKHSVCYSLPYLGLRVIKQDKAKVQMHLKYYVVQYCTNQDLHVQSFGRAYSSYNYDYSFQHVRSFPNRMHFNLQY